MEKLRRENEHLKTELAMEFRQFKKPGDSGSSDRTEQVLSSEHEKCKREVLGGNTHMLNYRSQEV